MKKNFYFFIKIAVYIFLLALFAACIIPNRSGAAAHIALSPFEKKISSKIEFDSSRMWLPGGIFLKNMSIVKSGGKVYYCETADIKYNLFDLLFKNREVSFDFEKVKFYRDIGLLDSITDMLSILKMPDAEFNGIEGTLQLRNKTTYIKRLYAHNDSVRINASGWIDAGGSLDCTIKFSFHKSIVDKVPGAVRKILLTSEEDGWMGISFKGQGNYKKPSLRILSDRIELNILKGLFQTD